MTEYEEYLEKEKGFIDYKDHDFLKELFSVVKDLNKSPLTKQDIINAVIPFCLKHQIKWRDLYHQVLMPLRSSIRERG